MTTPLPYPTYTREERLADASMHLVGVVGGFIASVLLIWFVGAREGQAELISVVIYCVCIMISLIASALYHFSPSEEWRETFRHIDHGAIFLKIAGTYTPLVVLIGGEFSFFILGMVWTVALGGFIWKVFFWTEPGWGSIILYLSLGWFALALAWPFVVSMPWESSLLVVAGGLLYTFGVVFYKWESLKFSVAIWHGFVIAASSCFYAAIYLAEAA